MAPLAVSESLTTIDQSSIENLNIDGQTSSNETLCNEHRL